MPEPAVAAEPKESTSLLDEAKEVASDHWSHNHEMDDDVRKYASKFTSEAECVKGGYNLEKLQGTMIAMPKEDDTDEVRAEKTGKIRTLMGCPEKAEDYKNDDSVVVPEGMVFSPEADLAFKSLAHSLGLSNAHYNEALKWELERGAATRKTSAIADADEQAVLVKERALAVDAMKMEHGEAGYKAIMTGGLQVLKHYGSDSIIQKLQDAGLDNDPEVMGMFHKMFRVEMAEDAIVKGDPKGGLASVVGPKMDYPTMDEDDG